MLRCAAKPATLVVWLKASIHTRGFSSSAKRSSWNASVSSAPVQAYISAVRDPYLNLSIENYLFRKSPHGSAILFIYRNRPCVVIGRNQNPWLELNLRECLNRVKRGELDIVRRYSGGGTVYHDMGNVNWSVISPLGNFTRDKHAEMVVRALRASGVERARVNERHDIVLDQALEQTTQADVNDTHRTRWTTADGSNTRKCSGSAYKLTRGRALHHGTCLLNSDNLAVLADMLRSPARAYIAAKGVESVSSPVSNTGVFYDDFVRNVRKEFSKMYARLHGELQCVDLDENAMKEEAVLKSYSEMRVNDWTYGQTPRFTFEVDGAGIASSMTSGVRLHARHAQIEEMWVGMEKLRPQPHSRSLHGTHTWAQILSQSANESFFHDSDRIDTRQVDKMISKLEELIPIAPPT